MKRVILLLLLASCKDAADEPRRFEATIVRPPKDTIRFSTPATARPCYELGAVLLEAVSVEGNGMLVHVRFDSARDSSTYPVLSSTAGPTDRGAAVAVRYMTRQVSHTFPLDSGSIAVRRDGRRVSAHVEGRGLENAIRMSALADFREVPIETAKVSCQRLP